MQTKWALIALVILIVLGGGFVYWQKNQSTTNLGIGLDDDHQTTTSPLALKTYTGTDLAITMGYPLDWSVSSDANSIIFVSPETAENLAQAQAHPEMGGELNSLDLAVTKVGTLSQFTAQFGLMDTCVSLEDCLNAMRAKGDLPGGFTTITVDGETAYAYSLSAAGRDDEVALEHNGTIYVFIIEGSPAIDSILNQMLSSVRFTR